MKIRMKEWISFLLIIGGGIFFGWNAMALYTGTNAPTELKIGEENFKGVNHKSNKPFPLQNERKLYEHIPKTGDKIGELSIPRLKQTYPIYQGTSSDILMKGAGHVESSALPGEANNSVISGHRDTIFRGLKELKPHDSLIVTTDAGSFLYKIKKFRVVEANDRTVLTPKPRAILTVTTCYPFYYIGNAPQRYIVVSELISSQPTGQKNETPSS